MEQIRDRDKISDFIQPITDKAIVYGHLCGDDDYFVSIVYQTKPNDYYRYSDGEKIERVYCISDEIQQKYCYVKYSGTFSSWDDFQFNEESYVEPTEKTVMVYEEIKQ